MEFRGRSIDEQFMKVISTSDVPLSALRSLADELGEEFELEVDESQVFLRSTDPPSWVTFLAEASWWNKLLGAYAALYVAELVKEAAKETWRSRGKALVAAKSAGHQLRRLAASVAELRSRLSGPTTLGLGLPVPDELFSTRLTLDGTDPDELAIQIALFIHHLPALSQLISTHALADGNAGTGVFLRLRDDGALLVSWHDRHTLKIHEHVLEMRVSGRVRS